MLRRLFAILLGATGARGKPKQFQVKIQKSSLGLDLWTFALAAPTLHFGEAEPIFRQTIQTIKFAD